MKDLHAIEVFLLKFMLENDLLNGDCMTVTGKITENLTDVSSLKEEQDLIRSLDNPIKSTGHIRILREI